MILQIGLIEVNSLDYIGICKVLDMRKVCKYLYLHVSVDLFLKFVSSRKPFTNNSTFRKYMPEFEKLL